MAKEGFVTIDDGEKSYSVSIEFATELHEQMICDKYITVTCPVDYDGTVFQIGYSCAEMRDENSKINYAERLYTIDELPYYADGKYYFFTFTND